MSGPAATAFRWKKYRFDVPGHVARQSGKHLPGKFVSLPAWLPALPPLRFWKEDVSQDGALSVTYWTQCVK